MKRIAVKYITYSTGLKEYFVALKYLKPEPPFDSIKKPFKVGFFAVPTGIHAGVFLTYYFNSRYYIGLSESWKYKNLYISNDDPNSSLLERETSKYYGPVTQIKLGCLTRHKRQHSLQSINLVYDFRYKLVDKYDWFDGNADYNSTYSEVRSEQIYAHSLLFIFSQSYRVNHNLQWGLFAGSGVLWGHTRIHHYKERVVDHKAIPYETFSSARLQIPFTLRAGIFVSYNALSFGKRKNK